MKRIIFAIVAAVSINASAEYVTVEVCNQGESGNRCEMVTYKVRTPNAPTPYVEQCPVGDSGYGPCAKVYGVPTWLKKLNAHFTGRGFKAPIQDDIYKGGN